MSKLQETVEGTGDKLRGVIRATKGFFEDVVAEGRKTTWPGRRELTESTIVVIVSVLLLSLVVGVSDKILVTLLKVLISRG